MIKPKISWALYALALTIFTECPKALETTETYQLQLIIAKERYERALHRTEIQQQVYADTLKVLNAVRGNVTNMSIQPVWTQQWIYTPNAPAKAQ